MFVQSLSLPLLALASPLPWSPASLPPSFPGAGPVGVAGIVVRDPPGTAKLEASGYNCVQRGLEVEGSGEGPLQTGEGWFFFPPPLGPGWLRGWLQPDLLLLESSPSGALPAWAPASTHTSHTRLPRQRCLLGTRALCWTTQGAPTHTGLGLEFF